MASQFRLCIVFFIREMIKNNVMTYDYDVRYVPPCPRTFDTINVWWVLWIKVLVYAYDSICF